MNVSFVVPCYQSRRTLGFTLKSIFAQRPAVDFEVIVVDSSEDPVTDWIKVHFPSVRVHHSERRLYPGAARNLGARLAQGERVAFLDADAAAHPDWLLRTSARLNHIGESGVVGGYIGNANPTTAGSRVLHWVEFSEFLPGRPGGLRPFLSSSNLLVNRQFFESSGGFPENIPASEDRLFFHRIREGIFFESATGVLHYHRTRWKAILTHISGLGFWAGYVRQTESLTGSALAGLPHASWLLPIYRTPAIITRVARSSSAAGFRAVLLSPLILAACTAWSAGFRKGLLEPTAGFHVTSER